MIRPSPLVVAVVGCMIAGACGPDWDELDPSEGGDGAGATGPASSSSGATGAGAAGGAGASGTGASCNADDGLECTDDACVGNVAKHDPRPAGDPCTQDGGQRCDGSGHCVECVADADCTSPETCTGGACACAGAETCASLGLTCGSAEDGCGGVLDCDNGIVDGTETDVDCGGAGCAATCSLGAACNLGSDCDSGFCVDGVCCQSACTATCMACNVAATLGTCVNTPQLQDDSNGTVVCTLANTCDGLGACKKDAGQPCNLDTECASGNCQGPMCQ